MVCNCDLENIYKIIFICKKSSQRIAGENNERVFETTVKIDTPDNNSSRSILKLYYSFLSQI